MTGTLLDNLLPQQLRLLRSAAVVVSLQPGDVLLRRHDASTDLYLLESGLLEIVDPHEHPEVIRDHIEPGALVGEMAFLDESPRSADVRAARPCKLLRWASRDLRALLNRQADLGMRFYAFIARSAVAQLRRAGRRAPQVEDVKVRGGSSDLLDTAEHAADLFRARFIEAETRIRSATTDTTGERDLFSALDRLEDDITRLYAGAEDPETEAALTAVLARELHPYLVRSALAERAIGLPDGVTATAEVVAHVMVNKPQGEGRAGERLDRWLLNRPTLKAMRALQNPLIDLARLYVADLPARRLLLASAGTGSMAAGLLQELGDRPTDLTVLDHSRETLAFLDVGVTSRSSKVRLHTIQDSLAGFAAGRMRFDAPPQDLIVLQFLLEYLPDRLVSSLLNTARRVAGPGATLLASTLAPSKDAVLLDRLFDWPMVRRSRAHLHELLSNAGWLVKEVPPLPGPAVLLCATLPPLVPNTARQRPEPSM